MAIYLRLLRKKDARNDYLYSIYCNKIIIELKGVKSITKEHYAQVLNYLKATELKLGLIVNFGANPKAEIKRIVL